MPERKFFKLKVENGKLKIAVGQTVCKRKKYTVCTIWHIPWFFYTLYVFS